MKVLRWNSKAITNSFAATLRGEPLKHQAKLKKLSFQWWLVWGFAALVIVSAFPVVTMSLGYNFIPSPMWAAESGGVAILFGMISFLFGIWIARFAVSRRREAFENYSAAYAILLLPFFMFFLGQLVVFSGAPSILAFVFGKPIEFSYQVRSVDMKAGRHCGSEIKIAKLPFLANRLCRVPDQIRKFVHEGASVVIGGRGTGYGIWVQTIKRPWE